MRRPIAVLRDYDIGKMILCHCTGTAATDRLASEFPGRVVAGYAGLAVSPAGNR